MKRPTLVVLLALLMTMVMVLGASPALAGEESGPPGPDGAEGALTPINSHRAASICSFSGLNDEIDDFETTQTQSYGTFLVLIKSMYGFSTQEVKASGELPSPGVACNPNRGFEE